MTTVAGFPCVEIEFDKDGEARDPAQAKALPAALAAGDPTDILLLCHGWCDGAAGARTLYRQFLGGFRNRVEGGFPGSHGRRFAAVAALWPSRKPLESAAPEALDALKGFFGASGRAEAEADAALDKARALVPRLREDAAARETFAGLLRSMVPREAAKGQEGAEDASADFFRLEAADIMERLGRPFREASPAREGRSEAAARLVDYVFRLESKARAGRVGALGLGPLIRAIRAALPGIRVHGIGQGHGGRALAAAARSLGKSLTFPTATWMDSLALLQAAVGRYGFAEKWDGVHGGAYREVIADRLVRGPILVTRSAADRPAGSIVPLAALLAGLPNGSAVGTQNQTPPDDGRSGRFAWMGRDGALGAPEAVEIDLLPAGRIYEMQNGRVHNLRADGVIRGHGDVAGEEIAYAVLAAIART
jgi:hypothetical protein